MNDMSMLCACQDEKPLNVNYPNENLRHVTIPPDFLNKISTEERRVGNAMFGAC